MALTGSANAVVMVGMMRSALLSTMMLLACGPEAAETGGTTGVDYPDTTGVAPAECPAEHPAVADVEAFARKMGEELCAKARACGCANVTASCEELIGAAWRSPIDDALLAGQGLSFNASCAAEVVEYATWESCKLDQESPCPLCAYIEGPRQKGESCEEMGFYSTCAGALTCFNGVCTDMAPPTLAVGAACWDAAMQQSLGRCEADTRCDDVTGTCVALPASGEPCEQGACAAGAYCNYDDVASGVCVSKAPGGVACSHSRECASQVCFGGECYDHAPVCRLAA